MTHHLDIFMSWTNLGLNGLLPVKYVDLCVLQYIENCVLCFAKSVL